MLSLVDGSVVVACALAAACAPRPSQRAVTYALSLGAVGVGLLLAAAVVSLERQRSSEDDAAHLTPLDEQLTVHYVAAAPIEPIASAGGRLAIVPLGSVGSVLGILIMAAVGGAIWYLVVWYVRRQDERLHQYRRTRSLRPRPRVASKRREIMASLSDRTHDARVRLTIGQLMTESIVVSSPKSSIATLTNLLLSSPLRQALICDRNGRLLGIVTDRDLRHRRGKRARDVMTQKPTCVPSTAPLGLAAALMVDNQISCVPVVDEGRVRGVLTSDDLALALDCLLRTHEPPATRPVSQADETEMLRDLQTLCDTMRAAETSAQSVAASPVEMRS